MVFLPMETRIGKIRYIDSYFEPEQQKVDWRIAELPF
jgi:hypothetical protein